MQDILPPRRRPNTKNTARQPMRGLRLQGHSIDSARGRLFGEEADSGPVPVELPEHSPHDRSPRRPSKWRRLQAWWQHLSRNKRFGIISGLLLLFAVSVLAFFYFTRPTSEASISFSKSKKPKPVVPTTVASPLTGLPVAPELANRPVTGIMIENSPDARPQSGIQYAGVVFEAIAEGGITRFMTLYQDARPDYIGPVRSLRPYYIDWASAFDASVAHIGGSPDALSQIRNGGKDLDQFFNPGSYWRISSRVSPHNVYTNFDKLDALNHSKGYTASHFTPWPRKAEKKLAVPTAKTINLAISSFYFNVHYDYDAATNSYLRSEGGTVHNATTSENDKAGAQLRPKVVLALIMPYNLVDSTGHSGYGVNGSGTLYVFQDGGVTTGTWSKASRAGQFSFKDASGIDIKLDAGQTWATVLGAASMVSYAP